MKNPYSFPISRASGRYFQPVESNLYLLSYLPQIYNNIMLPSTVYSMHKQVCVEVKFKTYIWEMIGLKVEQATEV
jgi:hypothetical protein